jgi:hypothetical protein
MVIALADIRQAAMGLPGMFDDFLSAGRIEGTGLAISREAFDALQARWGLTGGIGSVIHTALAPAVKAIDAALGTDLKNCGGCAGRELKWNAL